MKRYRVSVSLPYTFSVEVDAKDKADAIAQAKAFDPDAFSGKNKIKVEAI